MSTNMFVEFAKNRDLAAKMLQVCERQAKGPEQGLAKVKHVGCHRVLVKKFLNNAGQLCSHELAEL